MGNFAILSDTPFEVPYFIVWLSRPAGIVWLALKVALSFLEELADPFSAVMSLETLTVVMTSAKRFLSVLAGSEFGGDLIDKLLFCRLYRLDGSTRRSVPENAFVGNEIEALVSVN
jgi:hypothetical protein